METANAVIECPEGNENSSGGVISDQQCGSISQGRRRLLIRFTPRKSSTPSPAAIPVESSARNLCGPPKTAMDIPNVYHSHPSPMPRCKHHEFSKPLWRPPAMHAPHQSMIASFNSIPHCARDGHMASSTAVTERRVLPIQFLPVEISTVPNISADQRRTNAASSR